MDPKRLGSQILNVLVGMRPNLAWLGQIWPYFDFQSRDFRFASDASFHGSMKIRKSDFEYFLGMRSNLANFGLALPNMALIGQIWPDFNFQARDFKFMSNLGFHESITTIKSDLEYLVNMRPNLAKSGLAWTNMA